jgi:DNA helicase TIP49 (TBP-interacting protein)
MLFDITNQKQLLIFSSRKKALEYFKSGNRESALRYIRRSKMLAESRNKSSCMLEKIEHILRLLADAESTYKVQFFKNYCIVP